MGGEHSLQISALQLLWFGIDSVLKILNKRMTHSICAVVVSTIAVKRSNKAAALEAGKNGGQTDSTEFHLGQGEAGKGDSLTDLF